ncbi:Rieske 2Fe-2S domain-containing protein [Sphingomonas sp. MMS24-J13]|uniref:aromatic ring-hydroxylating dioxygenase subunit alpha n=1 Tax=Sphingomonas sp. MMS24-J13 TaxID=3238686 RepID=UPI00384A7B5C
MLTTRQPVLRKFWYATLRLDDLKAGPKPFTLMGTEIVLFLDENEAPVALRDRCCHRTAKLSIGWCEQGRIVCGYHGWTFDGTGALVRIPQYPDDKPLPQVGVDAFHCQARYGYAWVCLDEPIAGIPAITEDDDPGFRRIMQIHETWRTSPMRLMENSFDAAHPAFVHRNTFGRIEAPRPTRVSLTETDDGFWTEGKTEFNNPANGHRVTGSTEPTVVRDTRTTWYLPFCRKLDISYDGRIRHIIFNCATPVDDEHIVVAQILFRNDSEADCPAEELIAWDSAIVAEDKLVLEATEYDAPLDASDGEEASMISDRPGLVMRKQMLALLRAHGETEVRREGERPYVFRKGARPIASAELAAEEAGIG